MSSGLLIAISVAEAALLVVVLAVALLRVRHHLACINEALGSLGGVLAGIEGELQLIGPAVGDINQPLEAIAGALPGIASMAEEVARR